jgi:hypothetical protein
MVSYLCIVAIVAIPAARAVERTICKFTIDNRVTLADVDDVSIPIAGDINDWRVVKTIEFDGDVEKLTICGYDDGYGRPSEAGFLLKCAGGWWDGVKSDTSWYVTSGHSRRVTPIDQARALTRESAETDPRRRRDVHTVVSTSGFNCGGDFCDQGEKIWAASSEYPICFTKFLPRSDDECDSAGSISSFNLKCQFTSHCEYRYEFGDITVDASCRLKEQTECGAGTCSSTGLTPCSDSTEYRDLHCGDAGFVQPDPLSTPYTGFWVGGFVQPDPLHAGRSCTHDDFRWHDLGAGFTNPLECIEFAEKVGCDYIEWNCQTWECLDWGCHCCEDVDVCVTGGIENAPYAIYAVPFDATCPEDAAQDPVESPPPPAPTPPDEDEAAPPEPLHDSPRECETRGLALGASFDTVDEALEFAAQQNCKHIMWSPLYHKQWGSHCCVDDGTNGRANTYYEVYAVAEGSSPAPTCAAVLKLSGSECPEGKGGKNLGGAGRGLYSVDECGEAAALQQGCDHIQWSEDSNTNGWGWGCLCCDVDGGESLQGRANIYYSLYDVTCYGSRGTDEPCETSSQCQADLFCNGDPKCEACYYPGDLLKDEAACDRYVQACCEHGLSSDAALCVCAGSDGNSSGAKTSSLAIIIPVVVAAVLLLAAILFLVRKRVVAGRMHRRESMPTVGGAKNPDPHPSAPSLALAKAEAEA